MLYLHCIHADMLLFSTNNVTVLTCSPFLLSLSACWLLLVGSKQNTAEGTVGSFCGHKPVQVLIWWRVTYYHWSNLVQKLTPLNLHQIISGTWLWLSHIRVKWKPPCNYKNNLGLSGDFIQFTVNWDQSQAAAPVGATFLQRITLWNGKHCNLLQTGLWYSIP